MRLVAGKIIFLTSVLGLAACSHYSEELSSLGKEMGQPRTEVASSALPQSIQPAAGGASTHTAFLQYLARDYYDLARVENDQSFDYRAARDYVSKATIASKGSFVVPSKLSSYDLTPERSNDLAPARAALVTALKTRNTPENAASLAKAQSRFDCWIEQAEEATNDKHFAQCRSDFDSAMASLVTPAAGEESPGSSYNVVFARQSALPEMASQKDIDYVASLLKDPKNEAYSLTLTGYTSAGADGEFASDLTNARIAALQKMLADKGVRESQVTPVLEPALADVADTASVKMTVIAPASGVNGTTTTKFVPITPVDVPAGN